MANGIMHVLRQRQDKTQKQQQRSATNTIGSKVNQSLNAENQTKESRMSHKVCRQNEKDNEQTVDLVLSVGTGATNKQSRSKSTLSCLRSAELPKTTGELAHKRQTARM